MIKKIENKEYADQCDMLLNKLIIDEKKYDESINESFVVKNYFSNMIKNPTNILLGYFVGNAIVGYIFAKKIMGDDSQTEVNYLVDGLYVLEEYRNKGIAKLLINEIISLIKNKNAKHIDINVMNSNIPAKTLYNSLGFYEFKITLRKDMK